MEWKAYKSGPENSGQWCPETTNTPTVNCGCLDTICWTWTLFIIGNSCPYWLVKLSLNGASTSPAEVSLSGACSLAWSVLLCLEAKKWKARFLTWHHKVSHKSSIHFEARLMVLWSQKTMQPLAKRGRPNTSAESQSFLHSTLASCEQTTSPLSPPDLFIWSRIPLKIASFSPHVECSSPGIYDPPNLEITGGTSLML